MVGAGYLRWLVVLLPVSAMAAQTDATLTCEQVFAVAQTAVRYRDQGQSLDRVLAVLDAPDARSRLGTAQMQVLRNAVSGAYLGNATPEEIALECVRRRQ